MTQSNNARLRSLNLWRSRIAVLVVPATFIVSGCPSQSHVQPAEIRPLPYSTGPVDTKHVDGLRQALARSGKASVRVLVVHGMITHERKYSENLQQRLASRLGLVLGESSDPVIINRGYDFTVFSGPQPYTTKVPLRPSEIRKTTWVDPDSPKIGRLVFYELLWAPLRDDVKSQFLACFESRSVDPRMDCSPFTAAQRNRDSRALINGALKDQILVEGFADATLVLGPVGDVLLDDVALAMCMVAADELNSQGLSLEQSPESRCDLAAVARDQQSLQNAGLVLERSNFFTITHSLGSFLVMDTQQRFAQARANRDKKPGIDKDLVNETLLFFLTDDSIVYMMANQISLLQLGRLSAVCIPRTTNSSCPNRLLRTDNDNMNAEIALAQMTTYVAFNDVNDLLGFELPPYLADSGLFGTLINVSVQNPAFAIPFLFKNPTGTHTNHDDNPAVIEAMTEGIDLPDQKATNTATIGPSPAAAGLD